MAYDQFKITDDDKTLYWVAGDKEIRITEKQGPESFGPRREKTCLRGFRQNHIQTSLLSYRD